MNSHSIKELFPNVEISTDGSNLYLQYPLSILIVDDNAVNQRLMNMSLSYFGYTADFAFNGIEAIEAVKKKYYDLIFMDVQMPDMDGIEATQKIIDDRTIDSFQVIIAMTANVFEEDMDKCLKIGMNDYLRKPVKPADIEQMILKWGRPS